jgi:hypothetical protein
MSLTPAVNMRDVRLAAQDLRNALNLGEAERARRIREAKTWLLSAADEYGVASAAATELYFSAPSPGTPAGGAPVDALTAILSDAQVGTTLIAAGHALGEGDAAPDTAPLDSAISAFETVDVRSRAVAVLNFAAEPTRSTDFESATKTLRTRAEETLTTLITQAHAAGAQVVDKLKKVDAAKALEALSQLGGPLENLPQLGELIRKGIKKLQTAMDTLLKLLDSAGLQAVKEKLTAFWNKLSDGTLIDSLLGWAFARESVQAAVDKAAAAATMPVAAFDKASDVLPTIGEDFKQKMAWAKTLTGVVAGGSGVLVLVGAISAGPVAVFVAGAYLLVLAAILLMGRDYAGEGAMFVHGKGLRAIIESVMTTV